MKNLGIVGVIGWVLSFLFFLLMMGVFNIAEEYQNEVKALEITNVENLEEINYWIGAVDETESELCVLKEKLGEYDPYCVDAFLSSQRAVFLCSEFLQEQKYKGFFNEEFKVNGDCGLVDTPCWEEGGNVIRLKDWDY